MAEHPQLDELLEVLHHLRERHDLDVKTLEEHAPGAAESHLDELVEEGLVRRDASTLVLTKAGLERATLIVRRHRLAERLLADVLHMSPEAVEAGACEFEHMASDGVTDSICTLLGHPRTCVHGMPIPEGDCCRAAAAGMPQSVIPLSEAPVGANLKIALVQAPEDQVHHRMAHLDLVPGNVIRLHQRRPSVVVAHGDNLVAMDEGLARSIYVWVGPPGDDAVAGGERQGLAGAIWDWITGSARP